jgi:hypothetical protein
MEQQAQEQKKPKPPKQRPPLLADDFAAAPASHQSLIDRCISMGQPCRYVKLQSPAPTLENKEPVYEFKTEGTNSKYKVDALYCDKDVLVWTVGNVRQFMPFVNVALARPLE